MNHIVFVNLLIILCLSSCQITSDNNKNEQGYISVTVIDENNELVKDVEIYLNPDSISIVTDLNGNAFFNVEVGDYFIDADVCCIGPSYIKYHEPVTVERNDTVKKELHACSVCM